MCDWQVFPMLYIAVLCIYICKLYNFMKLIRRNKYLLLYKGVVERANKTVSTITCRQINSLERMLPMFNVAIICSEIRQLQTVHEAVQPCFNHVEHLYFYNRSISLSGSYIIFILFCNHACNKFLM